MTYKLTAERTVLQNNSLAAVEELKDSLKRLRCSPRNISAESSRAAGQPFTELDRQIADKQHRWNISDTAAALRAADHDGAPDAALLQGAMALETATMNVFGLRIDSEKITAVFGALQSDTPLLHAGRDTTPVARLVARSAVLAFRYDEGQFISDVVVATVKVQPSGEIDRNNLENLQVWVPDIARELVVGEAAVQKHLDAQSFSSWESRMGTGYVIRTNARTISQYAGVCASYAAAGFNFNTAAIDQASAAAAFFAERRSSQS